jgi:hypothetical protein
MIEKINKLFLVRRPSMRGTSIPEFNYTFAIDSEDAIKKVRLKWGEFDSDIITRELNDEEIEKLVIGTDFY